MPNIPRSLLSTSTLALASYVLIAPTASAATIELVPGTSPAVPDAGCGGVGCIVRTTLDQCFTVDQVVPDQEVMSEKSFSSCGHLRAGNIDVLSGGRLSLRATKAVVLGDGFSVAIGGRFTAGIDTKIARDDAYLTDNSPNAESPYAAQFFLNLDAIKIPITEDFVHFSGRNASGEAEFRVKLRSSSDASTHHLFFDLRQSDGTYLSTKDVDEVPIGSGWHLFRVEWSAASAAEAGDGWMRVCVDGEGNDAGCSQIPNTRVPAPENPGARIDSVVWGASAIGPTASGNLLMDAFHSTRGATP